MLLHRECACLSVYVNLCVLNICVCLGVCVCGECGASCVVCWLLSEDSRGP